MRNIARSFGIGGVVALTGTLGAALFGGAAFAQVEAPPIPTVRTSDDVNVDVTTGLPYWSVPDVGIGPEDVGLRHSTSSYMASYAMPWDSFWGGVQANDTSSKCNQAGTGMVAYYVVYNGLGECFRQSGSVWTTTSDKGSTFEVLSAGSYLYTLSDGTRISISSSYIVPGSFSGAITSVVEPNGRRTDIFYDDRPQGYDRIRFVAKNNGFRLYYIYGVSDPTNPGWGTVSNVVAFNAAYVPCDLTQATCAIVAESWPMATYRWTGVGTVNTMAITSSSGTTMRFKHDSALDVHARFTSIQLPTSDVDNYTYTYCPQDPTCYYMPQGQTAPIPIRDMVVRATRSGQIWKYGMSPAGPYSYTRNSTDPWQRKSTMLASNDGPLNYLFTPDDKYYFSGGEANNLSGVVVDGITTGFIKDARGNRLETIYTPATSEDPVAYSATYPSSCLNRITCNLPQTLTDPNRNTTVFEYDVEHGGVTKSTGPGVGGVDRETRYFYVKRNAKYLSGSGAVIEDPNGIWLLHEERFCRTGAATSAGACVVPGDEQVTRYEYGPSTGVNNLLLRGVVRDATGLALRTCYGYDRFGNRISETTPNANLSTCP